ncbi:dihydroorotase, subgroup IIa [Campylobacter peloridis]|uniref:Dihydroorotase, subgroup IIa n=1 Tax=Campylobacter peloridis TaxID=488546 RepID=A0ABX6TUF0_9BACT|nr:dihydroorotase, subgroup IIa [Campylobacter peloridis]AJC85132.1 dihydroorotase, subgroup IIa [Campylobacter peloridis LMG 23910]QOQ89159.1 dihydroorotase, subgroup IIa [Campylobacter peloridis]
MIIKHAKIYGEEQVDLRIKDGKIIEIGSILQSDDCDVLDLQGKTLLPSFIDLNVSLCDDSFSVDNLCYLEKSCLQGGVGTIVLRDSLLDANTQFYMLYFDKLKSFKITILPTIKAVNNEGKLKDISILLDNGAKGLEIQSSLGSNLLRQSMQYASMKNSIVFLKCFDENFDDHGVMNDGKTSFELGLIGISDIAEISEVAKMKQIVQFYKNKASFDCLGIKKSFEILKDDFSEISIHHLIKSEDACENFNTQAKILPPLRAKEELDDLQKMLKNQEISFLSSLHSPKTNKNLAFDEAGFGIDSINSYASLCFTYFVDNKILNWRELCDLTSFNQAKFLGLNKGKIEVGYDADLIIFDENISTKGKGLYKNDTLKGKVKKHLINGEVFSF